MSYFSNSMDFFKPENLPGATFIPLNNRTVVTYGTGHIWFPLYKPERMLKVGL